MSNIPAILLHPDQNLETSPCITKNINHKESHLTIHCFKTSERRCQTGRMYTLCHSLLLGGLRKTSNIMSSCIDGEIIKYTIPGIMFVAATRTCLNGLPNSTSHNQTIGTKPLGDNLVACLYSLSLAPLPHQLHIKIHGEIYYLAT